MVSAVRIEGSVGVYLPNATTVQPIFDAEICEILVAVRSLEVNSRNLKLYSRAAFQICASHNIMEQNDDSKLHGTRTDAESFVRLRNDKTIVTKRNVESFPFHCRAICVKTLL